MTANKVYLEGNTQSTSIKDSLDVSSTSKSPLAISTTKKAPLTLSTDTNAPLIKVEMNEIIMEKYRYRIPKDNKHPQRFSYKVKLPSDVTCDRCVLQWTYKAGNTWGYCPDGTADVGCGPQEWFRNCGDISIKATDKLANVTSASGRKTVYYRNRDGILEPLVVDEIICVARDEENSSPGMDDECQKSCLQYPPQCDLGQCKCFTRCEAIGDLAGLEGTETYCNMKCLKYPSNCPKDKCR